MAEIVQQLRSENPELLEMASKCAADVGDSSRIMTGFGMFYRLLTVESLPPAGSETRLNPLPRVAPETRDFLVQRIDEMGTQAFTMESIDELERSNPELLQMAHHFASRQADYLGVMQGFGLLYQSLLVQTAADRARMQ